ncbi:MAG: glycosyltransferase family 4 protein [Saprospiraceae bacterium]|nr:glycosyltransferase family 4 protein [Saprospiraceae bacterium]
MRIAINARFLISNKLEGFGRFSYETLRLIVKNNEQHHFIFFFDRPYDSAFIFGDNVTPVVLYPPARHPFLFYIWFELMLPKALKKHKADIFFTPDGYCSLRSKIKTISVVHDLAFFHFNDHVNGLMQKYYEYFFPKFIYRASKIVTVSNFVKNDILQFFPTIDKEKILVACNGVSHDFVPLAESDKSEVRHKYAQGNPYFFYVGAVQPRKNIARLIAAFSSFKEKDQTNMQLLIAGRMAWKTEETIEALAQSKHKNDIKFLGFVSNAELARLVASATALVYVSLFEGFGIPIIEAFHAEVPVVTSNCSSMPEVAGDAALLVDPYNIEEISNALTKISTDQQLRQQLIQKGSVQKLKFSWEKAATVIQEAIFSE